MFEKNLILLYAFEAKTLLNFYFSPDFSLLGVLLMLLLEIASTSIDQIYHREKWVSLHFC